MLEKLRGKRKFIIILIVITIVIIISGLCISRFKDTNKNNKTENDIYSNDTKNYTIIQNEIRENISTKVKEEQKIKDLVISNVKIVYTNEKSNLTADVLNTSSDIDELKIKLKFLDNDTKIIAEKEFEVGDMKTNETKNISIVLEGDVSNTNLINYEIID